MFDRNRSWSSSSPLIDPIMGKSGSDIENKFPKPRLDALDSLRRDDSVVSKRLVLVQTTNDKPEMESLVFRLPTELTMQIFRECGSDIRLRVTLTHVCHRWRQIAVNDASLWTNIYIFDIGGKSQSPLGHFSSFLSMQIDHTANLPLDVKWFGWFGDDFFFGSLQIIRDTAPFSRWRSLDVDIARTHAMIITGPLLPGPQPTRLRTWNS
jgi:F-box-like